MSVRHAAFDQRLAARHAATCVAGVDEVGRGCLAGPVVVAAVVLPPRVTLAGVDDSKRLTKAQRRTASRLVKQVAVSYALIAMPAEEVDRCNVLAASLLGMTRAVERLRVVPDLVLVDGPYVPHDLRIRAVAVVAGDAKSQSIAAASVIAKVARDRLMRAWHRIFPCYGFDSNVGYPTPAHLRALQEHGACRLHRQSFAPVRARSAAACLPLDLSH